MSRDFYINGESLVQVKGRTDCDIASLSQLGLSADPITVSPVFKHEDINVDAWGQAPADVQWMLAEVMISMNLIHFDPAVLAVCMRLSMGGGGTQYGQMGRAGQRLGNNLPRFAPSQVNPATGNLAGNNYIGLNITSPVEALPYRFIFSYLANPPMTLPLGAKKSIVQVNFRAIPYTQDPYGGGTGAFGYQLWDNTLDT